MKAIETLRAMRQLLLEGIAGVPVMTCPGIWEPVLLEGANGDGEAAHVAMLALDHETPLVEVKGCKYQRTRVTFGMWADGVISECDGTCRSEDNPSCSLRPWSYGGMRTSTEIGRVIENAIRALERGISRERMEAVRS
jgi:hypothetical protein